ncbi:microfibrillar-associated protein family protein [Schizosaccharomyces japonicus yFS275]|uniref:Microfibrillar-associated protein family protein n=1 Tax=Schizosaccharomyces japonicus (strain yFS275 / FY16936) TaxID=402676 RepID=B6JUX5_SCHJY|nr:microfibrillar-associated protein family protein [Schizosaccharomyces japonicus yFS275]EEB05081.1 microfibrillar-associated protein family protein [Schizosaccharomyces japonicus yFS275]
MSGARIPRPAARYRAGKAVSESSSSSSESDYEEEELVVEERHEEQQTTQVTVSSNIKHEVQLHTENASETSPSNIVKDRTIEFNQSQPAESAESSSEYETENEASSDESEESSEEESSDEEPRRVIPARPVFFSKKRSGSESTQTTQSREDVSRQILEETIKNELQQKELLKQQSIITSVDDTDGLDPEGEYESWKLRKLQRKKRDKERLIRMEREREEVEARRLMNAEERDAEDMEAAEQSRRKEKSKMSFMQKYYHRGAFYQDQEILQRDFSEAAESEIRNIELLPKPLQVRGDKFSKAGQTKWTHLANEDTSRKDSSWYDSRNPVLQKTLRRLGGLHDDDFPSKKHKK